MLDIRAKAKAKVNIYKHTHTHNQQQQKWRMPLSQLSINQFGCLANVAALAINLMGTR